MIKGMNPKGIVLLIILSVMIFTASAVSSSFGADTSQQPLSFSNKDLESYENSADHKTRGSQSTELKSSEVRKTKAEDAREQKEKEYWCKKAAPQRKKIQRLNEEIGEKEKELAEENSRGSIRNKKTRTLNKGLAKIRKRLKEAEGNFGDLEGEAYRKGVPPGWLRCQFE
jgi:hypothetical protein